MNTQQQPQKANKKQQQQENNNNNNNNNNNKPRDMMTIKAGAENDHWEVYMYLQ